LQDKANSSQQGQIAGFFRSMYMPRVIRHQPKDKDGKPGLGSTTIDLAQAIAGARGTGSRVTGNPGTTSRPAAGSPAAAPADDTSPRAKLHAEYVYLLAGDGAELKQRMRWLPGAKRPSIGLRWAIGLEVNGFRTPPRVSSERDFEKLTGAPGVLFVKELQQRIESGTFGTWPQAADKTFREATFLGLGERRALESSAREMALDALAVIELAAQGAVTTMHVRVADLRNEQPAVLSSSVTNRELMTGGAAAASTFVDEVFAKIDAAYALRPMPDISASAAARRAQQLMSSAVKSSDKLAVLSELRYYQTSGLLADDETAVYFDKLLGAGTGSTLVSGSVTEREQLLKDWLRGQ
jgi:hypothetical protein